jgi:hypothetical protein
MAAKPVLTFIRSGFAKQPGIRGFVLAQRWPVGAGHVFATPRAAVSTVPARAQTPQSRAGVPCESTDGSRPTRTHFPLLSEMLANWLNPIVTATVPWPGTPNRAQQRSGRLHWTTSRMPTRLPDQPVQDSTPYSAMLPRHACHPGGMNSSVPAKRARLSDGWHSSRRRSAHARASAPAQATRHGLAQAPDGRDLTSGNTRSSSQHAR